MRTFFLITLLFLAVAWAPVVDNLMRAPAGVYYYGDRDSAFDVTGNLATVREGYNGHWLRFSKFTSTVTGPPLFIKFEYISIGQLARLFRADPIIIFYLARIVISLFYFFVIYRIVISVFAPTGMRVLAYILILFATGIALPGETQGMMQKMFVDSLVFQRLTLATHHYLLGGVFSLGSILFLSKALDGKKLWLHTCAAMALGVATGIVYAPGIVLVLISLPLFVVLRFVQKRMIRQAYLWKTDLMVIVPYALVIVAPILYIHHLNAEVWDWNVYGRTERLYTFYPTLIEYFLGVGLVYWFAWAAIPGILKRGSTLLLLFAPWPLIHPISVLVLSDLLAINHGRFFVTPYFVVFGLLAASCIGDAARFVSRKIPRLTRPQVTGASVLLILLSSYFSFLGSLSAASTCFCQPQFYDWGYPRRELMEAIWWLHDNTKENDIVLSSDYAGAIIPAFAGNMVYTSEWFRLTGVEAYGKAFVSLAAFYRGDMMPAEAKNFLANNSIAYVLYADQERQLVSGGDTLPYPFLSEVFAGGNTRLYAVSTAPAP